MHSQLEKVLITKDDMKLTLKTSLNIERLE